MERNVGGYDRIARLGIGAVLIIVGIAGYVGFVRVAYGPFPQALTSVALGIVGLILLATGVTQMCFLNRLIGRNTLRKG